MDKNFMSAHALEQLARLIRYFILTSTSAAGSGHPTSSLSAADIMAVLFFGGYLKADLDQPDNPSNDRVIFSKGHASPLFYALYTAAGKVSEEELLTLRKFDSRLEGHPMPIFPYTEAATGSLGQGLSIGAGMALAAKMYDKTDAQVYVLLGDSEMAEGSVWEAIAWAARAKLNNLIGIIDVNRLGQSGETMLGHDVEGYTRRVEAFGWRVITINGHDTEEIENAFTQAQKEQERPVMIIAKTLKGKGISFIENKEGWHGKALSEEQLKTALDELGPIDKVVRGVITLPQKVQVKSQKSKVKSDLELQVTSYALHEKVATRKAYGTALAKLAAADPRVIALDAETKNSTFAEDVLKTLPAQYVEMYIAEQNMVGVAVGLARRGYIPFCSTFAAFFTRAFDQIRMASYSQAYIKCVGSHAGASIGEDGPSQMGLEDLAQFRAIQNSVVLYPSDAVACEKLIREAASQQGIVYVRTTRAATPVIYEASEEFPIGGFKVVRASDQDTCVVIAAGITLHEALKAHETLKSEGINARIIDLYSVKPLDVEGLRKHAQETGRVITVEDHGPEGSIGEAVAAALVGLPVQFTSLAVRKTPKSGKPEELMAFEEINKDAVVKAVKEIAKK